MSGIRNLIERMGVIIEFFGGGMMWLEIRLTFLKKLKNFGF